MNEDKIGYPIYRMNEIHNLLCDLDVNKCADITKTELETFVLRDKDVLFNRTNSYEWVGRTGIYYQNDDIKRVFASYLVRLIPNTKLLLPEYLTTYLNTKYGMWDIKRRARQSINQTNVNPEEVKEMEIPLLNMDLQNDIANNLQSANKKRVLSQNLYSSAESYLLECLGMTDFAADTEARKIRIGNKLFFDEAGTMVAEVIDNTTSRGRTLRFLYDCPHDEFKRDLYALGSAPLPKYIIDKRESTEDDMTDFQCIFAKNEGAVTAPASGLHFSRELMKRMEIKGIEFAYITLHCALGNFHNIEVEDLTKHKMDSEQMFIGAEACKTVNKAKISGHHVCVVGTSVAKATETAVGTDKLLKEYEGWTNKFIFPPYEFGLADAMIANFYHPMSTLVMSTAAFGGYDLVMRAYDLAIKNGYKFGCYGDAMLIVND